MLKKNLILLMVFVIVCVPAMAGGGNNGSRGASVPAMQGYPNNLPNENAKPYFSDHERGVMGLRKNLSPNSSIFGEYNYKEGNYGVRFQYKFN